jgi:hypothetical protein
MSETTGFYGSASAATGAYGSGTSSTAGAYGPGHPLTAAEWARCQASQWEEAGRAVSEVLRRVPAWFRLPPAVEQHFQTACVEQLRGVRALIDFQIDVVSRVPAPPRPSGTRIDVG